MKKIIAALFLLAFLAQTFSKMLIVANYYTNVTAYAKNCINKAKPQLHCNGKCQMMKKLHQQAKNEEKNPEQKLSLKSEVPDCHRHQFLLTPHFLYITINYTVFEVAGTQNLPRSIFHPPGLSC